MTSPIYPPQGGSSEVWRIKLSPEIKRILAQFSHGGRCAHSPYAFQSCSILFDIINLDQGVLRSTQTHSPPKGNISLSNTDMIYADFNTWLCAILHVREHNFYRFWEALRYLKTAVWCVYTCVYTVCIYSPSEWEYCLGVYSVLPKQTVSEAGPMAMLHLRCITLPTRVAWFPNAGWSGSTQ